MAALSCASLTERLFVLCREVTTLSRSISDTAEYGDSQPVIGFQTLYQRQLEKYRSLEKDVDTLEPSLKLELSKAMLRVSGKLKEINKDIANLPQIFANMQKIEDAAQRVLAKNFKGIAPILLSLPEKGPFSLIKCTGIFMDHYLPLALLQLEYMLTAAETFSQEKFKGLISALPQNITDKLPPISRVDCAEAQIFLKVIRAIDGFPKLAEEEKKAHEKGDNSPQKLSEVQQSLLNIRNAIWQMKGSKDALTKTLKDLLPQIPSKGIHDHITTQVWIHGGSQDIPNYGYDHAADDIPFLEGLISEQFNNASQIDHK